MPMTNPPADNSLNRKPRKKIPRPDGTDSAPFKNVYKWSYRKWAWEFLRRNPAFIRACKQAASGTDDARAAVAEQFGLKQFKHYTEPYRGQSGQPKFVSGSIACWAHLNPQPTTPRLLKNKLCAGQVLIRFDLAAAMVDPRALERQLALARRTLDKRFNDYAALLGHKPSEHRHKVLTFGIYLRLLDALANGKSNVECARILYPERTKGLDSYDVSEYVKHRIQLAREYANERYRYLALLKGKPKGKKGFIIGENEITIAPKKQKSKGR